MPESLDYAKAMISDEDKQRLELAGRVKEAIATLKRGGKRRVAEACGVSDQAVTGWIKNGRIDKNHLVVISRMTGVDLVGLITGDFIEGEVITKALPTAPESNAVMLGGFDLWDGNTPLHDTEVALPFFREVELAAGNGRTEVIENHGAKLRFAKSTLKSRNVQAENAYCVTVSGNSMEPVLPDGSTVGVDVSKKTIKNGDMYAIDHLGSLRVKKLYALPGGGIRLKSWNDDEYPDEIYTADEAENIKIIGRVFWTSALW